VIGDRSGSQLGGRRFWIVGASLPTARRGEGSGQLGRVRIEAEADLTAALFDERRESIREIGQEPSL
jgi:hypothetical protein